MYLGVCAGGWLYWSRRSGIEEEGCLPSLLAGTADYLFVRKRESQYLLKSRRELFESFRTLYMCAGGWPRLYFLEGAGRVQGTQDIGCSLGMGMLGMGCLQSSMGLAGVFDHSILAS